MAIRPAKSYEEMHPGRFLTAALLGGRQRTLRIREVVIDDAVERKADGDTEEVVRETAGIVRFEKTEREWVLNVTNSRCLEAMFGTDPQQAIGKRVVLYPTKTKLGRLDVDAIRVWGSPDIPQDITFDIALPRRKPLRVTLRRAEPAPAPTATREPGED